MARKFECPKCGKKFRTESGLNWHLDHIHSESKGKLKSHSTRTTKDEEDEEISPSPSKIKYPIPIFPGTPEWRERLVEEKNHLLYEVLPKMEKEGKSYFEKKPIYDRLDKIFNELNK